MKDLNKEYNLNSIKKFYQYNNVKNCKALKFYIVQYFEVN